MARFDSTGKLVEKGHSNLNGYGNAVCFLNSGKCFVVGNHQNTLHRLNDNGQFVEAITNFMGGVRFNAEYIAASPDQSFLYVTAGWTYPSVISLKIDQDGGLSSAQTFYTLEADQNHNVEPRGLCVDTNGWLYVATALGIQVCDQASRVNFIIPTPQQPHDVCFGGKDLGELFIACGDKIYKRPTKAHGIVSGQMPPIQAPAAEALGARLFRPCQQAPLRAEGPRSDPRHRQRPDCPHQTAAAEALGARAWRSLLASLHNPPFSPNPASGLAALNTHALRPTASSPARCPHQIPAAEALIFQPLIDADER